MALVQVQETPRWKQLLGYVGPGFLVSVAYLDPGNLETDLQAGADHKYELLWIVLVGMTFAFIIQSRSAKLGVATGKHLAEHCKAEYPSPVKYCLWILAEVAVIAADVPEVIGTAFALKILFEIPIWSGVLLAGLNTLLILGLQRYGIRNLEVAICVLVLAVGGCFFAVMRRARPSAKEIVKGMFVPNLRGEGATGDAIALLGALIMPYCQTIHCYFPNFKQFGGSIYVSVHVFTPAYNSIMPRHNLFLHSALVISRKIPHSFEGVRSASKHFFLESGLALSFAFLINVAVVSVSGSVCFDPNLSSENRAHCKNITLDSAAFLFKNSLGNWSLKLYAISLLASGQSSTVTGTYAGQYIMQGFLDLKMKLWLRNLVTRCIAIAPSLLACIIGGTHGAAKLIIIASMILSFELPFALVPLLRFTSSEAKMGPHKNSILVSLVSWLMGFCSIGINMYFLSTTVIGRITSNQSHRSGSILTGVVAFPIMILYVSLLAYLTLKRENSDASSHNLATTATTIGGSHRNNKGSDLRSSQRTKEIEVDVITSV